ncbi:Pycsar system effector family protein [Streptomyces leeuwenhoekii]|uniref:Sle1_095 protein n=1 Tax=Streptomyces leeuwenhoekii TaxID=1437453 RepID=A0A0F7VPH6_STRLW|nr:Pycsar system effector family protein [Streptomyces leeuwenhoekii]CQR59262.1 sle1_095 [Streptomyces leeuwenhoekii]
MTTTPAETDHRCHDHVKDLTAHIARCDTKASLLLALTGTSLAGIITLTANTRPPAAVTVTGGLGTALLLTATLILLTAVRPNLHGPGWPRWPEMTHDELAAALAAGPGPDEVRALAALARRKYSRVRAAVDCTRAGITALALAGVLAAVL